MSLILRVASRALTATQPSTDTHDVQMAISHILLQNGWKQGIGGKIIKQVKVPLRNTPKTYAVDLLRDGLLAVVDRSSGSVHAKVRLKPQMSNSDIMNAAKTLNSGASKIMMADDN